MKHARTGLHHNPALASVPVMAAVTKARKRGCDATSTWFFFFGGGGGGISRISQRYATTSDTPCLCCCLLAAHSHRMSIGACDLTLCPIHGVQARAGPCAEEAEAFTQRRGLRCWCTSIVAPAARSLLFCCCFWFLGGAPRHVAVFLDLLRCSASAQSDPVQALDEALAAPRLSHGMSASHSVDDNAALKLRVGQLTVFLPSDLPIYFSPPVS